MCTVQYFGLVEFDLNYEYSEQTLNVLNHIDGLRSACTFSDVNGDGKFDCLMGIQNGGIRCYMGSDSVTIDIPEIAEYTPIKLNVFPNPGTSEINWTSPFEDVEVYIYSTTGFLISRTFESVICTDDWPAGIYVLSPTKTGSPIGPPVLWVKLEN